jgi:hypothetical protein
MLGMNGSLYNDFSFVHNLIAHSSKWYPASETLTLYCTVS